MCKWDNGRDQRKEGIHSDDIQNVNLCDQKKSGTTTYSFSVGFEE